MGFKTHIEICYIETHMFLEVQKLVEVTEYLKHIESLYLVDILEIYFLKKNF